MDATTKAEPAAMKQRTTMERASERELVVTRTFNGPIHLVFEAWTTPELFLRWWVPKSSAITLVASDMDIRTGGKYRLEFGRQGSDRTMAFFGSYIEVTPHSRLVWTNEEGDGPGAVSTVTFEDRGAETYVVLRDLYPSKQALDEALASGSTSGFTEQFEQLDAILAAQGAGAGGA